MKIVLSIILIGHLALSASQTYSVITIGGGPAGTAAALHTARSGFKTLLFCQDLGNSAQAHSIENWPGKGSASGATLLQEFHEQASGQGVTIRYEAIKHIDCSQKLFKVTTMDDEILFAHALIIATGAKPRIPALEGIEKFMGNGIALCLICDAPFDKNKDVAIFGHDDIALDKALRLSTIAHHVFILSETKELTAHPRLIQKIKDTPNITILANHSILQLQGNKRLDTIHYFDHTASKEGDLKVHSLYLSTGFIPNSTLVKDIVECTPHGYVKLFNNHQQTSKSGIFAAGLVEDEIYQKAANALGRGAQAGLDAIEYLQKLNIEKICERKQESSGIYSSGKIISLASSEQLDGLIHTIPGLMIVDFYIPQCPACIQLMPTLNALAQSHPQVHFYKIEYEKCPDLVDRYTIDQVPALLVFKDGILVENVQESIDKPLVEELIKNYTV